MNLKIKHFLLNTLKTLALPVIVLVLFGVLSSGRTLNERTILVTARQSVIPILLSMALIGNMKMDMIDFSAGGVMLASAIIGANLMKITNTGVAGLVIFCMLISITLATLTGFLNNKLKVPTLVLTLGLVLVYEAVPRILFSRGALISAKYAVLASTPWIFIALLVVFPVFYAIQNWSTYGHNASAVAGNEEIARSSGLNVQKIKQIGFTVSGIFLGVAGALYMSANGQVESIMAFGSIGPLMDAFMGVFLALFLSRFCNIAIGLVVGTFTMTALTNGFIALGVASNFRTILVGLMLLGLLGISANEGRVKQWRIDRERARVANAKYMNKVAS